MSSASPLKALQALSDVISLSTRDTARLQSLLQQEDTDESLGAPSAATRVEKWRNY